MAMTPEEKAIYRAKVQKSHYVDQPVVVTAAVPVKEPKITFTDDLPKTTRKPKTKSK